MLTEDFKYKARIVNDFNYHYPDTIYQSHDAEVKILCLQHGPFYETPRNHLNGIGCKDCVEPRQKTRIIEYLTSMGIPFVQRKKFAECRNKIKLPFDFYLHNHGVLIDFTGKHHYEIIPRYGGEQGLHLRQQNAKIKNEFAIAGKFILITIRQNENVNEILDKFMMYFTPE
jgi:hypothetical protein